MSLDRGGYINYYSESYSIMHPLDFNLNTKLITGFQKIATNSAEVYYRLQHLYVLAMDQYIYTGLFPVLL